jgi:hypothetical protein
MPSIGSATPIPAPAGANYLPDTLTFPSPDGNWALIFHTASEWHMGATGWQARILQHGRDATRDFKDVLRIAGSKGFRGEASFQPWSADSRMLAFVTWDEEPVSLYVVTTRDLIPVRCRRQYVTAAQFAPDMDRLLIASAADGLLVDRTGREHGIARWDSAADTAPHTFWMNSGRRFFLLAPASGRAKTVISFFSGEDGRFLESHDLDPSDLVPYDSGRYAELPRDGLCLTLATPRGVEGAGSLLDTWSDVRFDRPSGTLSLSVFRPVSSPVKEHGALRCRVEQRWVAVRLGP